MTLRRVKAYDTDLNDAYNCLFVFDHPDLAEPIRLTDAGEDVTVGGNLYRFVPIKMALPDQTDESPPQGRIVLDNVDRTAIAAIRSISSALTCEITVVLESDRSIEEMGPLEFEIRNVRWNAITLEADLVHEPILGVAWPDGTYNPADFPGMRI